MFTRYVTFLNVKLCIVIDSVPYINNHVVVQGFPRLQYSDGFQGKGDFNVTIFQSEIVGSARDKSAMWDFSYFISELNLVDLPLEGCSYMWSNNHDPRYHA